MGDVFDDVFQSTKALKSTDSPTQQLSTQYIIITSNIKVSKWQNKLYTTWVTFHETPTQLYCTYRLSTLINCIFYFIEYKAIKVGRLVGVWVWGGGWVCVCVRVGVCVCVCVCVRVNVSVCVWNRSQVYGNDDHTSREELLTCWLQQQTSEHATTMTWRKSAKAVPLQQGWTIPGHRVTVASKFCTELVNICGSSAWMKRAPHHPSGG